MALERPAPLLGHLRPCSRAQLIAGELRCEEELLTDLRQLCPDGPSRALRSGDAIARSSCRTRQVERLDPQDFTHLSLPVDVNGASAAELSSLPGIGPVLAERIIAARPFAELEALTRVRGIGPKRLSALRQRARVVSRGEPAPEDR